MLKPAGLSSAQQLSEPPSDDLRKLKVRVAELRAAAAGGAGASKQETHWQCQWVSCSKFERAAVYNCAAFVSTVTTKLEACLAPLSQREGSPFYHRVGFAAPAAAVRASV